MFERAGNVLERFAGLGIGKKPIAFVTHSLGGILDDKATPRLMWFTPHQSKVYLTGPFWGRGNPRNEKKLRDLHVL